MAHETPKYPGWNGLSDNPQRTSLNDDAPPNSQDWDQIVVEVIAQQAVLEETVLSLNALDHGSGNGVMTYNGTWTTNTIYQVGDVVTYAKNAPLGLYSCKQSDPTGNVLPSANTTLWTPMGIQLPTTNGLTANTTYTLTINNGALAWAGP